MSIAGDTCREYVRRIQAHRYDEIADVFASDAVWFAPTGHVLRGRAAIRDMYVEFVGSRQPSLRADNYVEDGLLCAMELSHKAAIGVDGKVVAGPDGHALIIPDGSDRPGIYVRRAMDHVTVNEHGEITRMAVYNAPPGQWVG